ncbi:MAG: ATPase [Bacillus thermozeamaize]|uniref:Nuclease SbcCD subunit C n=1 Tax=Bacillus thermozeamaize TaxID=230954 RepID=A0A1Y3PEY7_9BACI|nr:MAG: ATPase [Bacillus thermozeamaize]
MHISFRTLKLHNYKSHRDLVVEFGPVTRISGDNAKGKSSILESISWTLYGTCPYGSKLDPSPIGYDYDEVKAELLLTVDGKDILLGRGLVKGKAKYWINEVPAKATEYEEVVKSMFDKDLFLALFNPSYFFSLHWEKQRSMLLQYVPAPTIREVVEHLPAPQAEVLTPLLKKWLLSDIEAIHRDNKNTKDKQYIAAKSRTKTLQEQLDAATGAAGNVDVMAAQKEIERLDTAIAEARQKIYEADQNNRRITELQGRIRALLEQRDRMKAQFPTLKNEPIEDTCRVCGQALQGEARARAEEDKKKRIEQFKAEFDMVVQERKQLEEELAAMEYIDVSEQLEEIRRLEQERMALVEGVRRFESLHELEQKLEQAKADEQATLESLRESTFILDAVKAFRAKEAELQAEKVQSLFTALSIRLYEQQKNGEIKPTFEIEYDGRPYSKLSLSEGIRAGLELRDVLSEQSGIIAPCFIDNAESITHFRRPKGQLIISRVVAGQELKIELGDAE